MQLGSGRPSAAIYQFPKGGRANWRPRDLRETAKPPTPVVCTDAWYHQAAVEDETKGSH